MLPDGSRVLQRRPFVLPEPPFMLQHPPFMLPELPFMLQRRPFMLQRLPFMLSVLKDENGRNSAPCECAESEIRAVAAAARTRTAPR